MKTQLLAFLALIIGIGTFAQAPQGINYQAVARNINGELMAEQTLSVRIGIIQDDMAVWEEVHTVSTNKLGLFNLTIGNIDVGGSGSAGAFENIQWGSGFFRLKVDIDDGSGFTNFEPFPFQSVPYAFHANSGPDNQELSLTGVELSITGGNTINLGELPDAVEDADADPSNEIQDLMYSSGRITLSNDPGATSINLPGIIEGESGWDINADTVVTVHPVEISTKASQEISPLFEVKNDKGIPVFAVYNDRVMVYVDEDKKGVKGGFAVGGYSKTTKGIGQEYFRVWPDSTRIYVNDDAMTKGVKGGFAVGGYSKTAKGNTNTDNYMEVTRASTHVFFDEDLQVEGKGVKGGFAVGGYSKTKGLIPDQLMSLTPKDYSINHDAGRLMRVSPQNYFIGHEAGINTTGLYNAFIGYRTGRNNTSGAYNTFFGHEAGYLNSTGQSNTFIGYRAGRNNTSGSYNIFLGNEAGFVNSTGSYNTFLGYQSGAANTSGKFNIFIGHSGGFSNTDGEENVYLGYKAGYYSNGDRNVILGNMSGFNSNVSNSVIIGDEAGYNAQSGWGNVIIGQRAGFNNGVSGVGAARNTFVGRNSGEKNDVGNSNTYVGAYAGSEAVGGRYNTFLGDGACEVGIPGDGNIYVGYRAGLNNDGARNVVIGREAGSAENYHGLACDYDNNVIIGYRAGFFNKTGNSNVFIGPYSGYNETGANKLYIDNSSTTSPLIYGDFSGNYLRFNGNIGVNNYYSSSYGMMVNGGTNANYSMYVYKGAYTPGTFWSGSDARLKTDIHTIENALDMVMHLRGVRFNWDIDNHPDMGLTNDDQIGVIAQEIEEVLPELVPQDTEGFKGVAYGKLTAVLIEAVKEQQVQIEALERRISEMESQK